MSDRVVFFAGPVDAMEGPYFGMLEVKPEQLELSGEGTVTIPREAVQAASLLRRNGQAVSIRVRTVDGNEVSFGVMRFRLGRNFVMNHFLRTAELFKELRAWTGADPGVETEAGPGAANGRPVNEAAVEKDAS